MLKQYCHRYFYLIKTEREKYKDLLLLSDLKVIIYII